MDKIKFAIPKGSLEKATAEFFSKSGFKIGGTERTYRPTINDPQIEMKVLRPQEIPVFEDVAAAQEISYSSPDNSFESKDILPNQGLFFFPHLGGIQQAKKWVVNNALRPYYLEKQ